MSIQDLTGEDTTQRGDDSGGVVTVGHAAPAVSVVDEVIDDTFVEICELQRQSTVDFMIRVGGIILDRFYAGDIAIWRNHGRKDVSFRKLAERFKAHGDTGMSATSLQQAVNFYEMDQRIGVSARKHLMRAHVGAVVGLPDEVQRRLLDKAEAEAMTSDDLIAVAKTERKATGETRGRPPLPVFERTMNGLAWILDDPDAAFADLERFKDLDVKKRVGLYRRVARMRLECERLEREMAPHVPVNAREAEE